MEKQVPVELFQKQMDILYRDFPKGRPLDFFTPNNPAGGGFSLVAALSNLFEKIGLCELTPHWVKKICADFRKESMANGTLAGKVKVRTHNGSFETENQGTLIRSCARKGNGRIALMLDDASDVPHGWLLAVWDGKTKEPIPFPEMNI